MMFLCDQRIVRAVRPGSVGTVLLAAIPAILWRCTATEKEALPVTRKPLVCAHRGASGYAPENTLAAMKLAMEMGANMAELDVQQTADDHLVVIHDDRLERTTTGRGFVWQKTLPELRGLDAGGWFDMHFRGEPLPTLDQVIALVRGKMKLNIEVKLHGHERDIARLVIEAIRRHKFEKECIVTSFGHRVADEIKARAPDLVVGYIFAKDQFSDSLFDGPVDVLSAHYSLVDEAFVHRARAAGKQVHVWTVNRESDMRRMINLGVDAIITNYPDKLRQIVDEER